MSASDILATLEKVKAALGSPKPDSPFNGEFVMLRPGEMTTDPKSGITYCDQAAWDAFKAALEPSPVRPAGGFSGEGR